MTIHAFRTIHRADLIGRYASQRVGFGGVHENNVRGVLYTLHPAAKGYAPFPCAWYGDLLGVKKPRSIERSIDATP